MYLWQFLLIVLAYIDIYYRCDVIWWLHNREKVLCKIALLPIDQLCLPCRVTWPVVILKDHDWSIFIYTVQLYNHSDMLGCQALLSRAIVTTTSANTAQVIAEFLATSLMAASSYLVYILTYTSPMYAICTCGIFWGFDGLIFAGTWVAIAWLIRVSFSCFLTVICSNVGSICGIQ